MTQFAINVVVDPRAATRGLDRVNRGLTQTNRTANALNNAVGRLFASLGAVVGVQQILSLADSYVVLNNRIRVATEGAEFSGAVLERVFSIANNARVPVGNLAQLYQRVAVASNELGASQQDVLRFVDLTAQAMAIQGGSTAEAAGALTQLSQALGNANIQAQEFNSLVDGAFPLLQAVARGIDETGGSVSRLRQLVLQGRLTNTAFFEALLSQGESIERVFANTVPTIGQSFSVLRNRLIEFVGTVNETTGVTVTLSRAIFFLSENLETAARIATAGAAAFVVYRAALLALAFRPVAAAAGLFLLALGAIPALLVATITGLAFFSREIKVTNDGLATVRDFGVEAFGSLSTAIEPVIGFVQELASEFLDFINEVFPGLESALGSLRTFLSGIELSFSGILTAAAQVTDALVGVFIATYNTILDVFSQFPNAFGNLFIAAANLAIGALEGLVNQYIRGINRINELIDSVVGRLGVNAGRLDLVDFGGIEELPVDGFAVLGERAQEAFRVGLDNDSLTRGLEGLFERTEQRAQRRVAEEQRAVAAPQADNSQFRIPDTAPARPVEIGPEVGQAIRLLEQQASLLGLNTQAREAQNAVLVLETSLRRDLNPLEREAFENAIRTNQGLTERAELLTSITGPQEALIDRQRVLNEVYASGTITAQQFAAAMSSIRLEQAELNIAAGQSTFFDGFQVGIQGMLESVRNFSAEAGGLFADFFEQSTSGFANAAAQAIVFGDDIREGIGNAARSAVADLLAGLIKLGLQFVLNATLGNALGTAATAAGVAQASTLASAWAPAAASTSLASFGANAVPAAAGIASTFALTTGLSAVGGFKDGGFVSGPGGPRSDSIPAMLSNGEYVINAQSTARFRPLLERLNQPAAFRDGGPVGIQGLNPPAAQNPAPQGQGGSVRIVNVLDPTLMENFLSSAQGERVLVNTIERNANSINQILGA